MQIVVLLTSLGLHSIHIVNNIFLYNVPCVENENVAAAMVSRNGLPYSPVADFTDITSYMNIFCTPGRCTIRDRLIFQRSGTTSVQASSMTGYMAGSCHTG